MRCCVSGVVSFIWTEDGNPRYARVPRDEIRTILVRRTRVCIGLHPYSSHEIEVPFDGGSDDEDDLEDLSSVGPWGDTPAAYGGRPTRSFSHLEWRDKMFEALMSPIDTDVTFRWMGTTWEQTEGRPT